MDGIDVEIAKQSPVEDMKELFGLIVGFGRIIGV